MYVLFMFVQLSFEWSTNVNGQLKQGAGYDDFRLNRFYISLFATFISAVWVALQNISPWKQPFPQYTYVFIMKEIGQLYMLSVYLKYFQKLKLYFKKHLLF